MDEGMFQTILFAALNVQLHSIIRKYISSKSSK